MNIKVHPLNERQFAALTELAKGLGKEEAIWISGYFQGWITGKNGSVLPEVAESKPEIQECQKLTILYGTHTGRSEGIAKQLADKIASKGIQPFVVSMNDYNPKQITGEVNLAIIVSTHGEGEPPDMAEDFYNFMTGKRAPGLSGLNYSVLALGDRTYKLFCKTGIDIGNSLQKLGANELLPVVTCDVDYEEEQVRLEKGDRLILYSDGITECTNNNGEQFSVQRLMHFLEEGQGLTLHELMKKTKEHLRHWRAPNEFEDDVSLLALERV